MIVLDVEMTGLREHDEILQISIIDGDGNIVLNKYYKPQHHSTWEDSMKIHGITPQQVKDCPPVSEDIPLLDSIFRDCGAICGYNTMVDVKKVRNAGCTVPDDVEIIDVMKMYAPIAGDWSSMYGEYRYKTLSQCAEFFGYTFPAHDSLEDVKATLFCYEKVKEYLETHLSESQKEALSTISYWLYKVKDNSSAIFNSYSPDHETYRRCIDTSGDNTIKEIISEHSLPSWDWQCDISLYPTAENFNDVEITAGKTVYPADLDYSDPLYQKKKSTAQHKADGLVDKWRSSLYGYIQEINEKYGTELY